MSASAAAVAGERGAGVVGGALRDELLGRAGRRRRRRVPRARAGRPALYARARGRRRLPALRAARRLARRASGTGTRSTSPRSTATRSRRTSRRRDFTVNAIARPLAGGELVDPFGGEPDLGGATPSRGRAGGLRRTTRCGSCARCASRTSSASGSTRRPRSSCAATPGSSASPPGSGSWASSSGSRPTASAARTSSACSSRSAAPRRASTASTRRTRRGSRSSRVFGDGSARFPVSNDLRRLARTLLAAERPADGSPREIHRFRRAHRAVGALGARLPRRDRPLRRRARRAGRRPRRAAPPRRGRAGAGRRAGPEVGRLLELVAEERAAGTIATREEALELVRGQISAT